MIKKARKTKNNSQKQKNYSTLTSGMLYSTVGDLVNVIC